jgi:hypothetical protein
MEAINAPNKIIPDHIFIDERLPKLEPAFIAGAAFASRLSFSNRDTPAHATAPKANGCHDNGKTG